MAKCTHCGEDRNVRCSFSDCTLDADIMAAEIERLTRELAELRRAIMGAEPDPSVTHGQFLEMVAMLEAARQGGISRATAAEAKVEAAREFVKRHPSLTLIDLAEFEAFLRLDAALAQQEGQADASQ